MYLFHHPNPKTIEQNNKKKNAQIRVKLILKNRFC